VNTIPIVFLTLGACGSAFGWGCEGHQIVGLIAGKHLSPNAQNGVYELLKDHPIDPALSRFCQPVATESMADAATWADDSKRAEKTGTWHYLDIPRGVEHADLMNYCAPIGESKNGKDRPGCLLTALQYEFDILKARKRPARERVKALLYVIHLMGDLHQPLHTTTNDDQGGNCTSVTLFEDPKPANLHSAWDYGIIEHYLKRNQETPSQLADELDRTFQSKGNGWLHEPIAFAQWIWEGHHIAENVTYKKLRPRVPVALAASGPGCEAERAKTAALHIDIDSRYETEAMPVIERQLAKAGYRLAGVLNAAF
jgi:hypothetical protein